MLLNPFVQVEKTQIPWYEGEVKEVYQVFSSEKQGVDWELEHQCDDLKEAIGFALVFMYQKGWFNLSFDAKVLTELVGKE
jgi:hypothetical protein